MSETSAPAPTITFDDFLKVDIRVGVVVEAEVNEGARKPALKLKVDFGPEIGIRKTSAQITENHAPEALVGTQVLGVVNFPVKQIGKFMSEVLVLGVPDENGKVMLIGPTRDVPIGGRLY
ncbi:Methionine-tRNA ligase [Hartmannibacter diazotrophicus]|uniref:Methionine-tRNA ligase n=1 Tax=Hartmannibacter diazotrophicus TaxID=1482074 RepID=A0A2C9DBS2_9HYPH|nr:tRNA-binding protein [Hartmannibacter diazotrophicus]SON57055.1 Methionine-tRNA ligase [Hartmannibacter diazotrophicus]